MARRPPFASLTGKAARVAAAVTATVAVLSACGGSGSATGAPALSNACGPPPYFTMLPVSASQLGGVSVFGTIDAPGHVLPTPHVGLFLNEERVPFLAPGDLKVTQVRRVTYLTSPTREGETDYALFFGVCRDVNGWFGHLPDVVPRLASADFSQCEQYSTPFETVQSCTANVGQVEFSRGEQLGLGGFSEEFGLLAVDFGLTDDRVTNFYVTPGRYPRPTLHAVCPYEAFDSASRNLLYSRLTDGARPGITPAGEPRCGTMEVDVPGTAKGVWVERGVTGPIGGNEQAYITLAGYPYRPEDHLALSLGPAGVGGRTVVVGHEAAGRVNRPFEAVAADGLLYCYHGDSYYPNSSWLLSLDGSGTLRLEHVEHPGAASPCLGDPSTWSFSGAAMEFVR